MRSVLEVAGLAVHHRLPLLQPFARICRQLKGAAPGMGIPIIFVGVPRDSWRRRRTKAQKILRTLGAAGERVLLIKSSPVWIVVSSRGLYLRANNCFSSLCFPNRAVDLDVAVET